MSLLLSVCLTGACLWADSPTAREERKKKDKEKEKEELERWVVIRCFNSGKRGGKNPIFSEKEMERSWELKAVMSCWENETISQKSEEVKMCNVKQRKTGIEQGNNVVSKRAWEQERTANKRGRHVWNGEWKPGNEWGCEREAATKREGKTEVSLALILSQLFLPYQASPDMGEKHVPTMHCGSFPSAWNEPLTPSYQLRGRLPVPVALHLWIQGQICVQSSADRKTHTHTQTYANTCMLQTQPSAIKSSKESRSHHCLHLCLSWQFRHVIRTNRTYKYA